MLLKSSLILNILLISVGVFFAVKRYRFQQALPPHHDQYYEAYNTAKSSEYSAFKIDKSDNVMIGTSLTEDFPVEVMGKCNIRNRGIRGNRLKHLLPRLDAIIAAHPSKIFFEGGTNDIYLDSSYSAVMRDYQQVIEKLAVNGADAYIISIPPFDHTRSVKNKIIDSVNHAVANLCYAQGVHYIYINDDLKDASGNLISYATYDGIHLNMTGYQSWVRAVQTVIDSRIQSRQ
jgi:lysophospholipase L1-like esterase